jgi:hypothetical protein
VTEPAHTAGRAGRVPGAGGSLTVRVVALMAVSCLLGVVTAFLAYAGIDGIVALATHRRGSPGGGALVVIFVVATLTGWGCLAAWERRRRPAGRTHGPRRSVVRIVASCLLGALAALLAAVGVAGVVSAFAGTGGSGSDRGLGYVFVIAAWCGSGAWALMKSSRKPGTALPPVIGSAFIGTAGPGLDAGPGAAAEPGSNGEAGPGWAAGRPATRPAAGAQASYRERCSQLLPARAGACLIVLAASATGLIAVGGPDGRDGGPAGALLLTVALLAGIYLLLVLIDLPNGVEIAAGRFTVGALGVPPAGRLWRRISGPLDAVRGWDVHVAGQAPGPHRVRRGSRPPGRSAQLPGDLRLFSRRQYLRLVVDPAAVQARLPARVMAGYAFVPAARAGAAWDGVILIGTRHPARLTAVLEQAIPGRRQTPGS